jgi:hypothetical protein
VRQNTHKGATGTKRRQKPQKSDLMAEKGAHMAPRGVILRILTPNEASSFSLF